MGRERYVFYVYIYKCWVYVYVYFMLFFLLCVYEIFLKKKVRIFCYVDDRYIIMMLFWEINKLLVFYMLNFDEKYVGFFLWKNELYRMYIKMWIYIIM